MSATTAALPFEKALVQVSTELYRYARSLAPDPAQAEDLVQETMVRAIANRHRFAEGTNLRAWTFTILRNFYYAQWHKLKRLVEWDQSLNDTLESSGGQEASVQLSELYADFETLPRLQRDALVLISVAGCTYEEAARIEDCPIGTMKSRVSRARAALEHGSIARGPKDVAGFEAFLACSDALMPDDTATAEAPASRVAETV